MSATAVRVSAPRRFGARVWGAVAAAWGVVPRHPRPLRVPAGRRRADARDDRRRVLRRLSRRGELLIALAWATALGNGGLARPAAKARDAAQPLGTLSGYTNRSK